MDTGPREPVLNIIREEVRKEEETLHLLRSPFLQHIFRSGREGHRAFRETQPAH